MFIPSFRPSLRYRELMAAAWSPECDPSRFMDDFARYIGVKHAVSVPSARWGLYSILRGLGLQPGDEVIVPAFTYFAVPAAVVRAGLKPVFIDIEEGSLNMDPRLVEEAITEKTRAVIPTHLCGFVGDMDAVLAVARRRRLAVIEDCAQSCGASYKGRMTGSLGDAAYFSLAVTKNFTTLGGGIVVTDDDCLAARMRADAGAAAPLPAVSLAAAAAKACVMKLATSGAVFPVTHSVIRLGSRAGFDIIDALFAEKQVLLAAPPVTGTVNNVQAALGRSQLATLDSRNTARAALGRDLYARLLVARVRVPQLNQDALNIFSSCPVFTDEKTALRARLIARGIDVSSGYVRDCTRLEIFRPYHRHCPRASRAQDSILYLPLYDGITGDRLAYVADCLGVTGHDHGDMP